MSRTILVVDDEPDIVKLISYNLEREGFTVVTAPDGETALREAQRHRPDLILLDLMLPGLQGIEVCRIIRNDPLLGMTPLIMVSAKSDLVDRVIGLEMGADDYITKPFSVKELVARVNTVLRRTARPPGDRGATTITCGDLSIDFQFHTVRVGGNNVDLSPTEFKLLSFLARHPGRVYTRSQLLDHVWGDETFVEERTVDVHVRRLRSRIEKNPASPEYIITVRGFGYKFGNLPH